MYRVFVGNPVTGGLNRWMILLLRVNRGPGEETLNLFNNDGPVRPGCVYRDHQSGRCVTFLKGFVFS
jgi:hypothetical protein